MFQALNWKDSYCRDSQAASLDGKKGVMLRIVIVCWKLVHGYEKLLGLGVVMWPVKTRNFTQNYR